MADDPTGTIAKTATRPFESRQDRKRRWFRAGAEEFARTFPEVAAQIHGGRMAYACPICAYVAADGSLRVGLFGEEALDASALTFEHVPPDSVGGRELALTCAACSQSAGRSIDEHAAEAVHAREFLSGRTEHDARIAASSFKLDAKLDLRDGRRHFDIRANPPEAVEGFLRALQRGKDIRVAFNLRDVDDRIAKVSWLKSAHVALFALCGYRYAFSGEIHRVRLQIQEPKVAHIPLFTTRLDLERTFEDCCIFHPGPPDLPECVGVLMGPQLVLIPAWWKAGAAEALYSALTGKLGTKASFSFTATNSVWPTEPVFARR